MFKLTGKIALITGAASGIGTAIAETYAKAGATVWLADRDFEGAVREANRLAGQGAEALPLRLDVTSGEECATAVGEIGQPVDILVNNAGIGAVGTLLEATGEELDRLFNVNVKGVFNVSKAFLPAMVERRSGVIVNIASIGGVVGIRDRLTYCTTKFAVVGMTKAMALDHAGAGIRVNCICPARVETPFVTARLAEYPDPVAARREMESTQLFGRMVTPGEIAAAALYLASDEAAMVTGTSFLVDCGWTTGK